MGIIKKIINLFFLLLGLVIFGVIGWAVFSSGESSTSKTQPEPPVFSEPVQALP